MAVSPVFPFTLTSTIHHALLSAQVGKYSGQPTKYAQLAHTLAANATQRPVTVHHVQAATHCKGNSVSSPHPE